MMTNNLKAYELNDMENESVVGGDSSYHALDYLKHPEVIDNESDSGDSGICDAIGNAVNTAWEVVKYAVFG